MAGRKFSTKLSSAFLIIFGLALLYATYRDITEGEKSLRTQGRPYVNYTRDSAPGTFLITVGGQFVLGLLSLGGGLYLLTLKDSADSKAE